MDIYDNSEYKGWGYSGVNARDILFDQMDISITQGSTNHGGHPRINAYTAKVYLQGIDLFYLYMYEGGPAYAMLNIRPFVDVEQIANMLCATACQYTNITTLLRFLSTAAYIKGKREGKYEVRDAIKVALGLEE